MRSDDLLAAVLNLPTKERARLAHELIVSLDDEDGQPDPGWERAWRDEISRRLRAVREGKVALEDGPTVAREIESELRELARDQSAGKPRSRRTRRRK